MRCELLSDFVYSFFEHNQNLCRTVRYSNLREVFKNKKIRHLPDFFGLACGFSEQLQLDAFFRKIFGFLRVEEFHRGELFVGYPENSDFPFGRKERLRPLYVDIRILRACAVTKIDGILEHYEAVAHQLLAELRRSLNLLLCVGRQIKKHHNPHNTILAYTFRTIHCKIGYKTCFDSPQKHLANDAEVVVAAIISGLVTPLIMTSVIGMDKSLAFIEVSSSNGPSSFTI